jgi:hypothetical protein
MTGEVKLISIELTEEECRLFRLLREKKVFDTPNCNFTAHFDKEKKVSLIDVHTFTRFN